MDENRAVVHGAWKLHYDNIMHSMRHGYYQGWDLNPGQLPVRYAAMDTFFLSSLQDASARLNAFLNKAAQATLVGNTFDDAATGSGLAELLPARNGLRCDHRAGSAGDGNHPRRIAFALVCAASSIIEPASKRHNS
jgi:hypothetical protein